MTITIGLKLLFWSILVWAAGYYRGKVAGIVWTERHYRVGLYRRRVP